MTPIGQNRIYDDKPSKFFQDFATNLNDLKTLSPNSKKAYLVLQSILTGQSKKIKSILLNDKN